MKKGLMTTTVAIGGSLLFIATLGAFIVNKIDIQEFSVASASITAFTTFLIGLFSKDANKTHSDNE